MTGNSSQSRVDSSFHMGVWEGSHLANLFRASDRSGDRRAVFSTRGFILELEIALSDAPASPNLAWPKMR